MAMNAPKRLFRRSSTGRVAGVCAGIAEYLDTDVALVRLAWIVLSIVPGGLVGGVLAYAAAWVIVPDMNEPAALGRGPGRLTRSATERTIAGVCGGLAEYFGLDVTVVRLAWAVLTVVPGCIVLGVVAYVVAWLVMPLQAVSQTAPGASGGIADVVRRAS
jgi:phage shock protein PspC (stress-responsive transcriptional regulator)